MSLLTGQSGIWVNTVLIVLTFVLVIVGILGLLAHSAIVGFVLIVVGFFLFPIGKALIGKYAG